VADDLTLAHQLAAAHQAIAVDILAGGAGPSTIATRLELPVAPGDIVRDRRTGLYGTIEALTTHDPVGPRFGA